MDNITRLDSAVSSLIRVLLIQERRLSNDIAVVPFNPIDIETLSFVSGRTDCTSKDVAAFLQVGATTMQSVIDRLEKRGLIMRDKAALKGRAVALALTQEGEVFRSLVQAQNLRNCEVMLSAVDPSEQDRFVEDMVRIAAKFT